MKKILDNGSLLFQDSNKVLVPCSAVYPVLEVEGVVEQHNEDLPGSPRPLTPQTPNTPLSPQGQGEELIDPQPELLGFGAQLPTSTAHTIPPTVAPSSSQPKVLLILYPSFILICIYLFIGMSWFLSCNAFLFLVIFCGLSVELMRN